MSGSSIDTGRDVGGVADPITARLLGATEIRVGDRLLGVDAWPRRTARSLLLLLLSAPGQSLRRDEVVETLWPELAPDAALNELYKALHSLRRVLEPDLKRGTPSKYLRVANETIMMLPAVMGEIDLIAFEAELSEATTGDLRLHLRRAITRYSGDFLADDPYSEWPLARRELLRANWVRAVLDLAELDLAAGEADTSRAALIALLNADPTQESAHRALIRIYIATSRFDAARRQYASCVEMLRRELDIEPDQETDALRDSIPSDAPSVASSLKFAPIPVPPTRLIGRANELDEIQERLLADDVRLVTLTGPGGIGKTHLALAASAYLDAEFDGGAVFVGLASVRDPNDVLRAISRALGIVEDNESELLSLVAETLGSKHVLMVIDNFEQVVSAAPIIADLLARAHGLSVLATSREHFHVRGEQIIEIGPLATPNPHQHNSPQSLVQFEAVRLYQDRVRDRQREFVVNTENANAIAEICHRIDGIPLAIELVAAQTATFTPSQLLQRFDSRLDLLVDGPRDLPDRLRTMRNAIAWSYDLLSQEEQHAARLISVFADGATEDAVGRLMEQVGGEHRSTTPVLASLVSKSLIRLDSLSDPARYRMLETVREFGIEQLGAAGDFEAVMSAHCAVYVELLTNIDIELLGDNQIWWFDWLQAEHQNIQQALAFAIEHGHVDWALTMASSIWRYWNIRGYGTDGLLWLERALAMESAVPSFLRAQALRAAGRLAIDLGDLDTAEQMHHRAGSDWHALDDVEGQAMASNDLGNVYQLKGEFDRAEELFGESLSYARQSGVQRPIYSALSNLGNNAMRRGDNERAYALFAEAAAMASDPSAVAQITNNLGAAAMYLGRVDEALERAEQALRIWKQLGGKRGIADALLNTVDPLLAQGNLPGAFDRAGEALELYRETGERFAEVYALHAFGVVSRRMGNLDGSSSYFRLGLALAQQIGDRQKVAELIEELGLTEAEFGHTERAIMLIGASEAMRAEIGSQRTASEQQEIANLAIRLDLNRETNPHWREGKKRDLAELIAEFLA